MTATPSSVTRETDASGDAIKSFTDTAGREVQAMALNPETQGGVLTTGATNATPLDQTEAKGAAGWLAQVDVVLTDPAPAGAPFWLLAVDKASAAVNGDVPFHRSPKMVGDFASVDLRLNPKPFALGCQLVVSTSPADVQLPGGGNAGFFQWAVA